MLSKKISSLQAIYLFGSVASSQNNPKSDLDLAFLSDEPVTPLQRWETAQALASEIDCDIDLIDLETANEVMRFEVISTGKRLFVDDLRKVEAFEDKVYMLYIDLNENRMGILNDIAKRGSVY